MGFTRDALSLCGRLISFTAPADGETLVWNATTRKWTPGSSGGQSAGSISGLKLSYVSATTLAVAAGKCRDVADTDDLTSAGATINSATQGAANGMDSQLLGGTGAKAAGVVTGTGTAFSTAFGQRAISGLITTVGTALTGVGTLFKRDLRVGDLIGDANGVAFSRVVSIASNAAATLADAISGGDLTGVVGVCIENPTLRIGATLSTVVKRIVSDASLTVSETATAVGAGAALRAGVLATSEGATGDADRHYHVWLTDLGLYLSTQRTEPFVASQSSAPLQRRLGTVFYAVSEAGFFRFRQLGNGSSRFMRYRDPIGKASLEILNRDAGWGGAAAAPFLVRSAGPFASEVALLVQIDGPVATVDFGIGAADASGTNYFNMSTDGAFQANGETHVPCDDDQYVTVRGTADANAPYYCYNQGYLDELS